MPSTWNGLEALRRMLLGCIEKAKTLERTGVIGDVDAAHINEALCAALIEVRHARLREPIAPPDGVEIVGEWPRIVPLPTEAERADERPWVYPE